METETVATDQVVETVVTESVTPATESAPEAAVVETAQSDNAPNEFDFATWDGDWAKIPPDFKTVHSAWSKAEQEIQALRERADEAELLFNALNDGSEDPRVKQYAAKLADAEAKLAAAEARAKEIEDTVTKADVDQATREWEKFKAANPLITNGPNSIKTIRDLLTEDWDLELIPKLYQLPKSQMAEVRELAKQGTPKLHAIELVTLRNAVNEKPKTAHLVVGAEDHRMNPANVERGTLKNKMSIEDKTRDSIARRLRAER